MSYVDGTPKCDGWCDGANVPVMIGSRGYIYCQPCGIQRRQDGRENVRKMRPAELRKIKIGRSTARGLLMIDHLLADQIAAAVARADFGTPSARKRGRNPKWPYVPIIERGDRQRQILVRAFATRDEAVEHAASCIEQNKAQLAKQLGERRFRALREQHGLPRELPDT